MTVNSVDINYTSLSILEQTYQTSGVSAPATTATNPTGTSAIQPLGTPTGDSAQISGPGQLFSQLQQLQTQDPTKLTQLLTTIASQIQDAANQSTGNLATFLTNLANNFQTAATTGNLSSLLPHHAHHASQPTGTYNQQGQLATPAVATSNTTSATSDTTSTGGTSLGQLFANIAHEVAQAVGVSA